jgi:hypothetical protein
MSINTFDIDVELDIIALCNEKARKSNGQRRTRSVSTGQLVGPSVSAGKPVPVDP